MAELHVFILWPSALHVADRIYDDLERRFELVDSFLVHWSDTTFDDNLMRLYGTTLPKRGQKVGGSADVPFHVLVVRDPDPRYEPRPRSWGLGPANAATYDAKLRYRAWAAGGGFGVHTTIDQREAERDVFLLTGRSLDYYRDAPSLPWTRTPRRESRDAIVGADGWETSTQLFEALRLCLRFVVLRREDDERGERVTLLVDDRDRATTLAAGAATPRMTNPVECRVEGRTLRLELREIGDGTLDPVWQRALLHHAVRLDDGTPAPPPHDAPYERLYELVAHLPPESEAARAVAESLPSSLPPGDYRNTVFARAVLEEFMLEWGYDYATPPPTMWRNPALFSRSATFRRSVRRRVPRAARIGGAAILRLSRTRA